MVVENIHHAVYNGVKMLRTQIYLPEYEYKRLKLKAKSVNKTFAEVVRDLLRLGFAKEEEEKVLSQKRKNYKKTGAQFLLQLARDAKRLGFKGSRDASVTIDQVVYDLEK